MSRLYNNHNCVSSGGKDKLGRTRFRCTNIGCDYVGSFGKYCKVCGKFETDCICDVTQCPHGDARNPWSHTE